MKSAKLQKPHFLQHGSPNNGDLQIRGNGTGQVLTATGLCLSTGASLEGNRRRWLRTKSAPSRKTRAVCFRTRANSKFTTLLKKSTRLPFYPLCFGAGRGSQHTCWPQKRGDTIKTKLIKEKKNVSADARAELQIPQWAFTETSYLPKKSDSWYDFKILTSFRS